MVSNKKSWVWDNFIKIDKNSAKCKICSKLLKRSHGSTTSLNNHLASQHNMKNPNLAPEAANGSMSNHLKLHKIYEQQITDETDESDSEDAEKLQDDLSRDDEKQLKQDVRPYRHTQQSWVWNYFKDKTQKSAVCTICKQQISRAHGSTSAMSNHLKLHQIYEREITDESDSEDAEQPKDDLSSDDEEDIQQKRGSQRSWVWNYFKELSKTSVICKTCKTTISRCNSSTSAMINHLKRHKIFEPKAVGESQTKAGKVEKPRLEVCSTESQRSWVWNYFRISSNEKAVCEICGRQISRNGSTTSGMRNHLRLCHSIVEEFENGSEKSALRVPQRADSGKTSIVQFIPGKI